MSIHESKTERRLPDRIPLQGEVVVELASATIVGPGQNISPAGVFFVADASFPVRVKIEGHDGEFAGELVRVETMGHGQLGIAVRFVGTGPIAAD